MRFIRMGAKNISRLPQINIAGLQKSLNCIQWQKGVSLSSRDIGPINVTLYLGKRKDRRHENRDIPSILIDFAALS